MISGRVDGTGNASGCNIAQEDFATQVARNNVIFRIPTPVFGAGPDGDDPGPDARSAIVNASAEHQGGVSASPGVSNRNGNDGTIARFGWKAQNKSLLLFSGEAYNVEMGITQRAVPGRARRERRTASSPRCRTT